jgi:hypothetical protein
MKTKPMKPLAVLAALTGLLLTPIAGCDDDATQGPACAPPVDGEARVQLIDHNLWVIATPEEDPLVAIRPADDITCPDLDREAEDFAGTFSYSIDTPRCPYTTVVQPLLASVCAGDRLYVWMWHFELTAPENSNAHLQVLIDGDPIWDTTFAIPGPSGLTIEEVLFTRSYEAGTPIAFHVRNHGNNTYNLLELSAIRGE